jgi:hypothetical protein
VSSAIHYCRFLLSQLKPQSSTKSKERSFSTLINRGGSLFFTYVAVDWLSILSVGSWVRVSPEFQLFGEKLGSVVMFILITETVMLSLVIDRKGVLAKSFENGSKKTKPPEV